MTSHRLLDAAQTYFDLWNQKSPALLSSCFSESVRLRDWEVEVCGSKNVVDANRKIFSTLPAAEILVINMLPCYEKMTVSCELELLLNNEENTTLKVVDVIEFDGDLKITALRAYRG
jgi:hypothetical protein